MAEDMKETTTMTRNKVEESSSGQMAESTMESGSTESSMVREYTIHLRVRSREENGKKAKESSGLLKNDHMLA